MPAPKDPIKRKEWIENIRKAAIEQFKNGMPEETKENLRKALADLTVKEKMCQAKLGKKLKQSHKNNIGKGNSSNKSHLWLGNNVGIKGRHHRIIKLKGKASLYKCIDCNEQARDWSNIDHKYSLNPDDYKARCPKCHALFDKQFNNSKRGQPKQ